MFCRTFVVNQLVVYLFFPSIVSPDGVYHFLYDSEEPSPYRVLARIVLHTLPLILDTFLHLAMK